jgi:hypothetical protein
MNSVKLKNLNFQNGKVCQSLPFSAIFKNAKKGRQRVALHPLLL